MAPGEQFLPGFARLLTDSAITRGAFSFFSGRSYLTGKFQGFFIFPGRFSEEKWRRALDAMRLLATSLEGAARQVSLGKMEGS